MALAMGSTPRPSAAAGEDADPPWWSEPESVCRDGFSRSRSRANELLDGTLQLSDFDPVPLVAALDWADPPVDDRSWSFRLHNLGWTVPLAFAAAAGDTNARDLLEQVHSSWSAANGTPGTAVADAAWGRHESAIRAQVFACAAALGVSGSAQEALRVHIDWLGQPANFDGAWNHGIDQALGLMLAGCVEDDTAAVGLGRERLQLHLDNAIDDDGVTNEQALSYQYYVHELYSTAVDLMTACAVDATAFSDTVLSLLDLVAHGTRPDGTLAPIGDTTLGEAKPNVPGTVFEHALTRGAAGPEPSSRVRVFPGGYAFGRDAWSAEADWFSLRFGPKRQVHGHRDHTSLLWDVDGAAVLTEAAFGGYSSDEWRTYDRSHRAHNVLDVPDGGRFMWERRTRLVHRQTERDWVSLSLLGQPYTALEQRRRSVLVSFDPAFVVVRDSVAAERRVTMKQWWHLPIGWTATARSNGSIVGVGPDGLGVRIRQYGPRTPRSYVVEGRTAEPVQAWVATGRYERSAAPVGVAWLRGTRESFVTIVTPTSLDLPNLRVRQLSPRLWRIGDGTEHTWVSIEGGNLLLHRRRP